MTRLGHPVEDTLALHSSGAQLQSAHLIEFRLSILSYNRVYDFIKY